jgi:hypothetical protein
MSFSTFTNIVTMMFCAAVLVQSVRMIRCLRAVKEGPLPQVVEALDRSTAQARQVLSELKDTLRQDCAANTRAVASGEAMREELAIMIGIANAAAERIVDAMGSMQAASADATTREIDGTIQ